ncbi:molybdate ABC transporter substrate-binding protein [Pseudaeromonas paramecii]|uniref:Molybdate ABC transporter substrate-binding protein n=1 Tax=Pseudaeromonas paramecii TaxID=2138166 RepID=A0ABP8Q0A1_9GAMM
MRTLRQIVSFTLLCLSLPALADQVQVAVAANFLAPMQAIASQFKAATGHEAVVVSGSTGKLFAQVQHGAPFEVFVSADSKTPKKLAAASLALADSQFTYAKGKLALWSPKADAVKDESALKGDFAHLAVANPKTAPYGAAALEVLAKLGLTDAVSGKLVEGENIGQTFQYVASGNAELGFVALSQIYQDGQLRQGSAWVVPTDLYSPLTQDAILLKKGEDNPAASALLAFLKGDQAKAIILQYGYML